MTLPLSEAEFKRQFAVASQRGAARRHHQPFATSVRYDAARGVMIELNNDCLVCVPLQLLPEVADASPRDLRQVQLMGFGQAIEWPTLDQQFDVLQLLADAVGITALQNEKVAAYGGAKRLRQKGRKRA